MPGQSPRADELLEQVRSLSQKLPPDAVGRDLRKALAALDGHLGKGGQLPSAWDAARPAPASDGIPSGYIGGV